MRAYLIDTYNKRERKGDWAVISQSKKPWIVEAGDVFVFFDRYRDIRFESMSRVVHVDESRALGREYEDKTIQYEYYVRVSRPVALPDDRLLSNLKFSLHRVFNFGRPDVHFRNRSVLDEHDLETIQTGRIHTRRSLYYGLLENLPGLWRRYFEHLSLARAVGTHTVSEDVEESPPVTELVALLEDTVLKSVALAADVQHLRRTIQADGLRRPIVAATNDRQQPIWVVEHLLAMSPALNQQLTELRDVVGAFLDGPVWSHSGTSVDLPPFTPALEGQGRRPRLVADRVFELYEGGKSPWRPHRW